ncbi:MAG: M23 family metallopeptidase [Firmicutes bacterium]|nr:M23 family metallopeptidase [Bacillota bacterium]
MTTPNPNTRQGANIRQASKQERNRTRALFISAFLVMVMVTAAITFTAISFSGGGGQDVGGPPPVTGIHGSPLRATEMTILKDFCGEWLQLNEYMGANGGTWRAHEAVSVGAAAGTDVIATYSGTVMFVGSGDYGNTVKIDHGNGIITKFASLENVSVREGDKIDKGNRIGTVGTSNPREFRTTPHVRIEVHQNGTAINPNTILDLPVGNK